MNDRSDPPESASFWADLLKYLIHGAIFSAIVFGLTFVWDFFFLFLLFGDSITQVLGILFLLLVCLFIGLGVINTFFARRLWNINPRSTLKSYLGQGLLFFFMLVLVTPLYYFVLLMLWPVELVSALLVTVVILIINSILSGYMGKNVAAEFESVGVKSEELASVTDRHRKCPHCGAYCFCRPSDISPDGYVQCPHCRRNFLVPVEGPKPEYSGEHRPLRRDDW